MFGVLLAQDAQGAKCTLKAFSGKLQGSFHHPGWVPPMLDLTPSDLELSTKARLSELKLQIASHSQAPVFAELQRASQEWAKKEIDLRTELKARKAARQKRRQTSDSLELTHESQDDSRRKKLFNRAKRAALATLQSEADTLTAAMREAKSERKTLSKTLQAEMHNEFWSQLWADKPWSVASLFPNGPPTGTGECCAPKLLHYANTQGLTPLAMAEIWCGPATPTRQTGAFYPACKERCQPMLGALLSRATFSVSVVFEDQSLLVVEKPPGLLSVPGREIWNQDSLLSRLTQTYPNLLSIHRLDMDTSGLLVYAKTRKAQSQMQDLFANREVLKTYQAILAGQPKRSKGKITLPLARDPKRQGCYLSAPAGKSAETRFSLLNEDEYRVEFQPITGRSHQLRVHALYGLGHSIQGDRLYGERSGPSRLKLHAHRLEFSHPESGEALRFESACPF